MIEKRGRRPVSGRVRDSMLAIRCSPEWRAWVERLGEFMRSPSLSDLADHAFAEHAARLGFEEKPPRR